MAISLAKHAEHLGGWQSITNRCRGVEVTRDKKVPGAVAFCRQNNSRRAGPVQRCGWIPYFCTDSSATVKDILEAAADRWAIEEHFHDIK